MRKQARDCGHEVVRKERGFLGCSTLNGMCILEEMIDGCEKGRKKRYRKQ